MQDLKAELGKPLFNLSLKRTKKQTNKFFILLKLAI
jgi:hypothetical protein